MTRRPPIIGLAGGIGSGKSTVATILADLGCVVSDSDAHARAALRDPHIKATIRSWWGDRVLDDHGEIDRSAVAGIVFGNQAERRRLEQLTHPWIEARRHEQFASAPPQTPALVIDAPLLFEAGLDRICDAVVFVDAPSEVRLKRVQAARRWDEAELAKREKSQLPLDAKRRRADHVVTNDGSADDLRVRVGRLLKDIIKASSGRT